MSIVSRRAALRAAATAGAAAATGAAANSGADASQAAQARAPKEGRVAQIFIGEKGQNRTVRVSHPGQLTPDEIVRIDRVLINDVIKELTGCACLSGTIDVIWERNFDRILDVRLG